MKAHESFVPWTELNEILVVLREAATHNNQIVIFRILLQLVQGYTRSHQACMTQGAST